MADEIAVYENETNIANIPAEEVKRVYLSLYHTHIPKLENRGLVTYDQDRDMVALPKNDKQLRSMEVINGNHL